MPPISCPKRPSHIRLNDCCRLGILGMPGYTTPAQFLAWNINQLRWTVVVRCGAPGGYDKWQTIMTSDSVSQVIIVVKITSLWFYIESCTVHLPSVLLTIRPGSPPHVHKKIHQHRGLLTATLAYADLTKRFLPSWHKRLYSLCQAHYTRESLHVLFAVAGIICRSTRS